MSKIHVLIFPAGEVNSVELNRALAHIVNIDLYGASSVNRHGEFVFKKYRGDLPLINDGSFIECFNSLIDEWNIDVIFPTHDTVALYLIKNKDIIHAKIIGSDYETAQICRDKKKTYEVLSDSGFIPEIYNDLNTFPCFIKPRFGQGSQNAKILYSSSDLLTENIDKDNMIISEYLPGDELSVDCITDLNGRLLGVFPRSRERQMAGIAVSSKNIKCTDEIKNIAEHINKTLHFQGLWYFQVKKDKNGIYKLLEISTRCPSTMCLTRSRGVNLPLLSVYIAMGRDVTIFENEYDIRVDRTLINRYCVDYDYSTVYVDYDDTIIEGDSVCIPVISFLYQCKNKGKKIVLLSRHEEYNDDSLNENMIRHSISEELFSEIYKLKINDKKCDYIYDLDSIFIDNAYNERSEIHKEKNIPVFDIEGVEVLMDWRV